MTTVVPFGCESPWGPTFDGGSRIQVLSLLKMDAGCECQQGATCAAVFIWILIVFIGWYSCRDAWILSGLLLIFSFFFKVEFPILVCNSAKCEIIQEYPYSVTAKMLVHDSYWGLKNKKLNANLSEALQ